MPFCSPSQVIKNSQNRITGMEFFRTEQNDKNEWIEDKDQTIRLKCDFVISAFGSTLNENSIIRAIEPVKLNRWGLPDINPVTMSTSEDWVFAGGDLAGISQTTVESVNDGKQASWHIHRFIQKKHGYDVPETPMLPKFFTPIDLVDIRFKIFCLE